MLIALAIKEKKDQSKMKLLIQTGNGYCIQ
jgi:hypothetical protein